jgi:glycosylphosphatidylinositol transamidase (GPIT) subunit GPI8
MAHGILHALGQKQIQGNISSEYDKDTILQLKANLDKLSFTDETSQMGILDNLVQQRKRLLLIVDFFENVSNLIKRQSRNLNKYKIMT